MKIIALEEHFATPGIADAWHGLPLERRDLAEARSSGTPLEDKLRDFGAARIAAMDAAGVDVAVLSQTTPGTQVLAPADALALARAANDRVAECVRARPDRFQGFATLPTPAPDAAAQELERAIRELGLHGAMLCGRTGERNLDHPAFFPLLETAARLRAPLYIHPQTPQPGVRQAYYAGLGEGIEAMFATAGIGWHFETGIQALRLILSGVFERLPDLRIVLGHWGEVVLFYLERIDAGMKGAHLPQPVSEYFRKHFWITPGGILSQRYLRWSGEVLGFERIMMATDYPYQTFKDGAARRFLQESGLDPARQAAIAGGTWETLCAEIHR
jgi:predicted TIM-barrel fold metal-dependent hydrolase